jgi:hypothetical protein
MNDNVPHDRLPWLLRLGRYGVPAVILMFYITAATGFSFTPDGTFLGLQWVQRIVHGEGFRGFTMLPGSGSPSPFWVILLSTGSAMHLDPLLLSKILSLFFSCVVILVSYLTALDITDNLIMAFCVALLMAANGLLLQAAPSGTPHPVLAALLLGALLCMIRHDRVLASLALGLACLMAWQAIVLAVPLCADIWMASGSRSRALRLLTTSYVVLTALIAPWLIYAVHNRIPWLTEIPPSSIPLAGTPASWALLAILAAGCLAGTVMLLSPRLLAETLGRRHILILGWTLWLTICALAWDPCFILAALPVGAAYAIASAHSLALRLRIEGRSMAAVFLLTALLLVLSQADVGGGRRALMAAAEKAVPVITELASRVRTSVPEEATLAAEWPGLVGYVAARPVTALSPGGSPGTDFAITAGREIAGYAAVYSAVNTSGPPEAPDQSRFLIWKRQ